MKYKIIHIHTDVKFIRGIHIWEGKNFQNEIYIFTNKSGYEGIYKDIVKVFSYSKKEINKAIDLCNQADIIVMWDLNFVKCYIANRININIKVIWRFFGLELYSKIPEYVFSKLTISVIEKDSLFESVKLLVKTSINKIKQLLRYQTIFKSEFNKAVEKTDYFLGLSDTEYLFLKEKWPELPPFLQNPYSHFKYNEDCQAKTNKIIIGNNRSAYNNHLDILYLIKNSKMKSDYNFFLMFNYGQNNEYTSSVRNLASQISNVNIIEDFLTIHEFKKFYSDISAFVLNGHRQMAMGNIFEALINHVKIYLNKKNVILDWLRKEGFLVYTIDDFKSDLEKNNIKLNESEILHNKKQLVIFTQKYCKDDFQNKILDIIAKTNK